MRSLQRAFLRALVCLALGSTAALGAVGEAGALPRLEPVAPNELTPAEEAAGWRLLFDGRTTQGWRGFKQSAFPEQGWAVKDGCLIKLPRVRGGDIVTTETFLDFELSWEWWIGPGGNNGVKYFITEHRNGAIGHEYQMIDDSRVRDPKGATAAFYGVLAPSDGKPPPRINDWNHSRILVRGDRVEHWLNGVKVLEYEPGSPAVRTGVAASKFRDVPGFGSKIRGHILLTDHSDEARFRNIKIRVVSAD